LDPTLDRTYTATYRDRRIELEGDPDWLEGTRLLVRPLAAPQPLDAADGHVIIVGFGLAGRSVADLLDQFKIPYTIVEMNPVTVETQRALGRDVIEGSGTDAGTLVRAGLNSAAVLALTIPDEDAVLSAITVARRLRPQIYIIARTNYSSKGMRAAQLGADDVVKAEQAVAIQFYDKLQRRLRRASPKA
jgi:CPA2 family monovalent cation:H+ antiporter-2